MKMSGALYVTYFFLSLDVQRIVRPSMEADST